VDLGVRKTWLKPQLITGSLFNLEPHVAPITRSVKTAFSEVPIITAARLQGAFGTSLACSKQVNHSSRHNGERSKSVLEKEH
jgi:hypothetical protein